MVEPLVRHIIEHSSGRCKVEVPGDAVVQLAHLSPRFHVCSVGDERVPLESAQNFANLTSASIRFFSMGWA